MMNFKIFVWLILFDYQKSYLDELLLLLKLKKKCNNKYLKVKQYKYLLLLLELEDDDEDEDEDDELQDIWLAHYFRYEKVP